MTTNPFAAYFDHAHRHWRRRLEIDLGDRAELERQWRLQVLSTIELRMNNNARSQWQTGNRSIK